ncbi:MAG: DUF1573 domain-containing protein [Planctomycetota bacterium]|nr:DUF1573 domain-containing protein [Planctomycetota bacterium]
MKLPLYRVLAALLLALLASAHAAAEDAPAKGADGPLVFDRSVVDYGIVDQNREYAAEVRYRNAGRQAIRDIKARASCSCYSVALTDTALEPGAEGTLTVRFRTHGFYDKISKSLHLHYVDGAQRKAKLQLVLNIVGGVLVSRLHLGEHLAGTMPSGSVPLRWYEGVGKPFEIERIEIPGQPIATRVEPFVGKTERDRKYKGWRIHFTFTEPPPRGIYSKRAIVTTTHPTQKRVLIPITANIVGKVWVQTSRVYLGLVRQGQTKTASVAFKPFKPEFKLGAVSARARKGLLTVKIEDGFGPMGPHKKLHVTVPADAPPGPLDDVIELRTEVPGEELVTVEVRGRVFVPRGG